MFTKKIKKPLTSLKKKEYLEIPKPFTPYGNNSLNFFIDDLESLKINNSGILTVLSSFQTNGYPIKTDIACWWCTYQFDGIPIPYPTGYIEKQDCFKVTGCFCSFSCSLSYMKDNNLIKNKSLLLFLKRKLTGEKFPEINYAPPRQALIKFGGTLTISEFREKSDDNGVSVYRIHLHPLNHVKSFIGELKLNAKTRKKPTTGTLENIIT